MVKYDPFTAVIESSDIGVLNIDGDVTPGWGTSESTGRSGLDDIVWGTEQSFISGRGAKSLEHTY